MSDRRNPEWDERTISEQGEISTGNNSDSDIELGAREAIKSLAHDDINRASRRLVENQDKL